MELHIFFFQTGHKKKLESEKAHLHSVTISCFTYFFSLFCSLWRLLYFEKTASEILSMSGGGPRYTFLNGNGFEIIQNLDFQK